MKYYIKIKYSYHPIEIKKETKIVHTNNSIKALQIILKNILKKYQDQRPPEISKIVVRSRR